jgi:hypothetical protein
MTGRTLGYSLLGGAGVLALLMLAWLGVSDARGGGVVLGLILLAILAGPLAIGGLLVLRRQPIEAAAETAFVSKRRVIEADRLFRHEVAPELRQLARQAPLRNTGLEELAEDLERTTYDTPEWYDAVQLSDEAVETLERYGALVWDRVRYLRDRARDGASQPELQQSVRELERALDQRRDLLVRGRSAPSVAPSVLVRAGEPQRGSDAIRNIGVGDAVTLPDEGADYVVEGVASYFAEGQTWKLVHLVPSGAVGSPRWLYVGPGGFDLALLEDVAPPPADGEGWTMGGSDLRHVTRGTATVDVDGRAGSARGTLVSYARYAGPDVIGLTEAWPDGARHAYAGKSVTASDLEVWPATAPQS